jgi:hypothetical protein
VTRGGALVIGLVGAAASVAVAAVTGVRILDGPGQLLFYVLLGAGLGALAVLTGAVRR